MAIIIMIGLVYYAIQQMDKMDKQTEFIAKIWMKNTEYVLTINNATSDIRRHTYAHILSVTKEENKNYEEKIKNAIALFLDNLAMYEKQQKCELGEKKIKEINQDWADYAPIQKEILKLSNQNLDDSAAIVMRESRESFNSLESDLKEIVKAEEDEANKEIIESDLIAAEAQQTMLYSLFGAILLLILLIIFIVRIITGSLTKIKTASEKVAQGDFSAIIDINQNDEIGAVAFAVKTIVTNLKKFQNELSELILNASQGKLTARGDVKKFEGGYFEIIKGINNIMDALINPLTLSANYIQKISVGEIPALITDVYLGDFNEIKNSINLLITSNKEIIDRSQQISKGDLTIKLKPRSEKDELLIALSEMIIRLNEIVAQITEATENVASGSTQLSSTASQIAQGANEQAASTEEVSSSIEEMTSTIQQNSENATQTEKIAKDSAQGILNVNLATEKSIIAIKEIAIKIQIINTIAEKTDILAINAAIEAARAGEHGKGFAVVAAEVRKLAEVSQKAAKEINELSRTSLNVTEEAGKLMALIIPNIQKTSQLVQEITAASSEQSSGATQISKAIEQLSQVTQQNSAAAEEMNSGSEELAGQAELLKEVISFFTIEKQIRATKHFIQHSEKKHIMASSIKKTKGVNLSMTENEGKDNEYEQY
jgi:methyl-accepting chemotaxis protein